MTSSSDRDINSLIYDVCTTVLVDCDCIETSIIDNFISNLTDSEKSVLNSWTDEIFTRSLTQKIIYEYVQAYVKDKKPGATAPFQFDSGNNYSIYLNHFNEQYRKENNNSEPPRVFNCVFSCIKESSEHFRLFEQFYKLRESEIDDRIKNSIKPIADNAARLSSELACATAEDAARRARKAADQVNDISDQMLNSVLKQANQKIDESIDTKVEDSIERFMQGKNAEINSNISTTSVTILGIFAGIVLTIVAGLFYSSSVLESVSSANFYRLLSIASLVGLVCFHLVIVMFRYIERISGKTQEHYFLNKTSIVITVVLIIMMLGGFILQFVFPESPSMSADSSNIHINAAVDVPNNDDTNAISNEATNDNSNADQPLPDETEGESSETVITDTSN